MSSSERQRREQVRGIFDRIAGRYDLLNRIISLHLDTYWRKKAVAAALRGGERRVLDLGTGTGDLALTAARAVGPGGKIVGLDFSFEMLRLAMRKKDKDRNGGKIFYVLGTALATPLGDRSFDAAMTAFVLRNVTDLPRFFSEAYRLLKPGGRLISLDMFPPAGFPFALLYSIYFHRLMPWVGARLTRDREAYRYLSRSVKEFHPPEAVADMIARAGFANVTTRKFLSGAVCLHAGDRPLP
jgi:demethylmenaquinone methyltransferase/2-methoxy-6-polyprenyl-1,4-benzoquinol methylase